MAHRNIKNLRIIRVLIGNPKANLTKYRIAKLANCSKPWVIEFLRKLEKEKLVKKTKVLNIDKLINYYLEKSLKSKYFDFFVQEPVKFLKQSNMDYALTTYGAENYTTNHLFPSRYDVYIKENDLERWKKGLIKNGLIGKGNLRLLITKDESIIKEAKTIKGVKIVSMPQLMIDLKREGGVCIEAYNILVKNV